MILASPKNSRARPFRIASFGFGIMTLALMGCGKTGLLPLSSQSSSSTGTATTPGTTLAVANPNDPNVVPLSVGNCGSGTYLNEPCVSVMICQPGTSNCQVIPNILLDTGSYGLRVFKSAVTLSTAPTTNAALVQEIDARSGNGIAECAMYGDGSEQWGPVVTADIKLGQRVALNVPMELIDSTYGSLPSMCSKPETGPAQAHFNGIMGVGLLAQDCGESCVISASRSNYFTCRGTSCTQSAVALNQQTTNPIAMLNTDNNGTIVQLPSINDPSGTSIVNGFLILGVGTQTNNTLPQPQVFAADANSQFTTVWEGTPVPAFIDSGSNGLFFPGDATLTLCANSTFFCPNSLFSGAATMRAALGQMSALIGFTILAATTIPANVSAVATIGAQSAGMFDWGLPFFFGRSVATVIQARPSPSPVATGPYWAF
jgi:hypothetical protein